MWEEKGPDSQKRDQNENLNYQDSMPRSKPADRNSTTHSNSVTITEVTRCLKPSQLIFWVGVCTSMKNTFTNSLLILAVGGLMIVGSASAQTSTSTSGAGPGVVDPGHPRVNEVNSREENQQQRIANGVSSGKLNSRQTANLENRETNVQNREKADMAKNNGHLTKSEQRGINRQQNRISRSIAKDKHSN
jgi:hypothetical protein